MSTCQYESSLETETEEKNEVDYFIEISIP